MRRVTRTAIPNSLATFAADWTKELMESVNAGTAFKDIPEGLKNKYRRVDVQDALRSMYEKKCCYCETRIGVSDYEHIDHLRPKGLPQFHHLTFEWTNLHWSCQRCNQKKKDQWNTINPILDPTIDDPEAHLECHLATCKIRPKNGSLRGQTTIAHTNLNRESLVEARVEVRNTVRDLVLRYKKERTAEGRRIYEKLLRPYLQQSNSLAYTLLIRQILHQYGLI